MPYEKETKDGKVICQLCGKSFGQVTPAHLKASHKTTMKIYKEQFPGFPTSGKSFAAKDRYSHSQNTLFKKNEKSEKQFILKEEPEDKNEKPIEIKRDEIQDLKIPTGKQGIFKTLKELYPSIVNNYVIIKTTLGGHLEYTFQTDIADPVEKVDFEFPKAFWHNSEKIVNLHRNDLLKRDGWKVVIVNSLSPTLEDIKEHIDIAIED